MTSPYILDNLSLQYVNSSGQDYRLYLAFLNPISVNTVWNDLNTDAQGNWIAPPNVDTVLTRQQPYAPTANLGPNRIAFVGEPLYFDGTRSCMRFDLPVVSYQWNVTGQSSITYYHNNSQIGVNWSTSGLFFVALTVTDRWGTTTTSTRQVMVYQDRKSALSGVISLQGLSGSLSSNGWTCQLTTVNSVASTASSNIILLPPDAIPSGTYQPIVVLCETRFEILPDLWTTMTLGPSGAFSPGYPYQDPRVLFDGYIQNGSVHQDVDKDTLSFICAGPQLLMQEAKTHQIGYYNASYKQYDSHGVPINMNTSPMGSGFLISGLMTADVIHSLLQVHSNIGQFHDIHIWNSNIPTQVYTPSAKNANYNLVYSTLSVNEGTILQNCIDLAINEWSNVYTEHDGSIRVGPQVNFRGADFWQSPTSLGQADATAFINLITDLGYTVGDTLSQMNQNVPILQALPVPIQFVHPWANQPIPWGISEPFSLGNNYGGVGPPILCVFSDVAVVDTSPPTTFQNYALFPWSNPGSGGQDLAIQPIAYDITENYTNRAALVKLIGTLAGRTSLWVSWYPLNAFQFVGTGTGQTNLVASTLPSGQWIIDQSHLLPDVTTQQAWQLMSNYWWEMAKRLYYATNINYQGTITLGMATYPSLGDIVAVTRQNNSLGPHWNGKYFTITDISHNLDLAQRTWETVLTVQEVTSVNAGPVVPPPPGVLHGTV